ncbi:hypothetical protein XNW1_4850002 [Xenorhabdus nematophila str. Websteri]|nr:hypothetical protein XNW1_4850002 [Xenorhabdus nematophila str. Websteri]
MRNFCLMSDLNRLLYNRYSVTLQKLSQVRALPFDGIAYY